MLFWVPNLFKTEPVNWKTIPWPGVEMKNILQCLFFWVIQLVFLIWSNCMYLKTHLLRLFQAQWACPALSYSLRLRGGTHLLLPDAKLALSQRVLPDPALQRKSTALPWLWTAPHWRCTTAWSTSAGRVRHIWMNMSLIWTHTYDLKALC